MHVIRELERFKCPKTKGNKVPTLWSFNFVQHFGAKHKLSILSPKVLQKVSKMHLFAPLALWTYKHTKMA